MDWSGDDFRLPSVWNVPGSLQGRSQGCFFGGLDEFAVLGFLLCRRISQWRNFEFEDESALS